MPHSISIEATAAGLNQFNQRFSNKIHDAMRQGLEFESVLPFVQADYAYTGQEVAIGDTLQPYQHQFTPQNEETFDGITSYLKPLKVDLLFTAEQLEKFFNKWRAEWFKPDPADIQVTYAQYVIQNHILPKVTEELNLVSWDGEHAAPTPGTPGAILESVDGFRKAIETHIADNRLSPITTGAIVPSTLVDQVREFCREVPEPYRYKMGKIFMSKTNAQYYADNYQDLFPSRKVNEEEQDKLYLRVDHYNKTIIGVTAMEGSDRMVMVFDNAESMIIGERIGYPRYFNFRFEPEDRTLKCFSEIYRFYNFETCKHCFVNEQS